VRFDEEIGEKFGGWCCWDLKKKTMEEESLKKGMK
jgi:hypothetical protein